MRQWTVFIWLLCLAAVVGCESRTVAVSNDEQTEQLLMETDTTQSLYVYYPLFTYIDLACGEMPRVSDPNVVMCLSAAFTGKETSLFSHNNIAGDHVASGGLHEGYRCQANTGLFVYYDQRWQFIPSATSDSLTRAADEGGMGFAQIMLVYRGKPCQVQIGGRNRFRALCEKDGRLCIVESRSLQDIDSFVRCLLNYDVRHALYLQPGEGWNYSWYRDAAGVAHEMHPKTHDYSTNWLTFYHLR